MRNNKLNDKINIILNAETITDETMKILKERVESNNKIIFIGDKDKQVQSTFSIS